MTEERFILVKCIENQWGIIDYSLEDVDQLILIHTNKTKVSIIVNELNRLNEENEQLKQAYTQLKHRHSLLHDECIDAECDRDRYRKDISSLEKENEQLKSSDTITDLETEIMNLKAILNDFINILNRLQSNPNDKQTLSVARDMLQNMGKELLE